uniref:SAM domain-containing protein n=1 Tax=Timema cristinae TaxID=61476 RepID=A0A7R9D5K9_TIMCR|nr:unnamed protein product [Timema cristinae]
MMTNNVVTCRSVVTGGSVLMTTNTVVTYRSVVTGGSVLMTTKTVVSTESVLMTTNTVVTYRSAVTGESVLMTAVKCGRVEVVKLLLDHGADPTFISKDGKTVLSIAETVGNIELVNCLWDAVFEKCVELSKFLDFLDLRKYYPVFLSYRLDMKQLLILSDEDLKHIGLRFATSQKEIGHFMNWANFCLFRELTSSLVHFTANTHLVHKLGSACAAQSDELLPGP